MNQKEHNKWMRRMMIVQVALTVVVAEATIAGDNKGHAAVVEQLDELSGLVSEHEESS